MDPSASFGAWLKQRRKALDLTQAHLADRTGCATVTIHKIEADGVRPSRQLAERLAAALAIPAEDGAHFVQAARSGLAPGDDAGSAHATVPPAATGTPGEPASPAAPTAPAPDDPADRARRARWPTRSRCCGGRTCGC